jgi:hypothetical protein
MIFLCIGAYFQIYLLEFIVEKYFLNKVKLNFEKKSNAKKTYDLHNRKKNRK